MEPPDGLQPHLAAVTKAPSPKEGNARFGRTEQASLCLFNIAHYRYQIQFPSRSFRGSTSIMTPPASRPKHSPQTATSPPIPVPAPTPADTYGRHLCPASKTPKEV